VTAGQFMATFSSAARDEPPLLEPEREDPRGIPVDVWRDGKWVAIWSKTGEVLRSVIPPIGLAGTRRDAHLGMPNLKGR